LNIFEIKKATDKVFLKDVVQCLVLAVDEIWQVTQRLRNHLPVGLLVDMKNDDEFVMINPSGLVKFVHQCIQSDCV
jgi:hypothetical protein